MIVLMLMIEIYKENKLIATPNFELFQDSEAIKVYLKDEMNFSEKMLRDFFYHVSNKDCYILSKKDNSEIWFSVDEKKVRLSV